MSAEAVEPPQPRSFRDASPQEVRAALVPEEQPQFDRQWRAAMAKATEALDLTDVFMTLQFWRFRATHINELGHDGYRRWLTEVEERARTGEPHPGAVPWSQLKAELGL